MISNSISANTTGDSYIISFTQGSSGRFVKYLLYSLLTNSSKQLKLCPITNSTHRTDDKIYTGHTPKRNVDDPEQLGNSHPEIWSRLEFDNPPVEPNAPRIFAGHMFPNFKLIRDRLGPNVKIIIVTIDPQDVKEVVVNDKVKNYHDGLTGLSRDILHPAYFKQLIRRYERFLGKRYPGMYVKEDIIEIGKCLAAEQMEYLLAKSVGIPITDPNGNGTDGGDDRIRKYMSYMNLPESMDYPLDQILLLPYRELYTNTNGEYTWLAKLEKFTGKTANRATKMSYQQYLYGRAKLIKEYRL